MIVALLAMLYAQSVAAQAAQDVTVYAWTDKPQYKPGETGTLKITVLNEGDEPIDVRNISIRYPWFAYNGKTGEWEGNETVKEGLPMWVDPGEVYYKEVEFAIPTDGRVPQMGEIDVDVETGDGKVEPKENPSLVVSSVSLPMAIADLEKMMTSLTVAIVVCTIILAIVIFLSTRKTRAPRVVAPPSPPPKAKTA